MGQPMAHYKLMFLMAFIFLICMLTSLSGLLSKRDISTKVTPVLVSNGDQSPGLPLVDQVVVVLVDALRPDFVFSELEPFIHEGNHECKPRDTEHKRNPISRPILTALRDSLVQHPDDTLATFLIADAPTTTSQRLKAIMTGTIPAFIEGGANFNSDEVIEDNLILQLSRARKYARSTALGAEIAANCPDKEDSALPSKDDASATVLGDDTWLTLFNSVLWQEYTVFPSFDVRDLDSNDEGVMKNVKRVLAQPVLKRSRGEVEPLGRAEADNGDGPTQVAAPPLLIMHFLGIDHAGHSFHAYHPEMERKISNINDHLRTIMALLEERTEADGTTTALVVMGDHGMTNSGDHGGDFSQETDTMAFTRVFRGGGKKVKYNSSAVPILDLKWAACAADRSGKTNRDPHATCRFQQCAICLTDSSAIIPRIGAAYQIDIVPTLAAMLSVGIPYSNLGSIIPEVITLASGGAEEVTLAAAESNIKQLFTYLGIEDAGDSSSYALAYHDLEQYLAESSRDEGSPTVSPTNLKVLALLRHMAAIAGDVRRSRAQMKVDRIFTGAAAAMLWGIVLLVAVTLRGRELLAADTSSDNTPLLLVSCVLLPATAAGILLDMTWMVLLSAPAAVALGVWALRPAFARSRLLHPTPSQPAHAAVSHNKMRNYTAVASVSAMVIARIIPPFSNSFVVFEDSIVLWLLGIAVVAACALSYRKRPQSLAANHYCAIALLLLIRTLMAGGIRQRRHHTHTIAALSPLDSALLHYYGWDGNLKGSSVLDIFYIDVGSSLEVVESRWLMNHFAVGQFGIRFLLNTLCFGGAMLGKGMTGATTIKVIALSFFISLAEHIPTFHHVAMVGGAVLWLAVSGGKATTHHGQLAAPVALLCAWAATLSTTPSARLTAAVTPLVVRLGVEVVKPFVFQRAWPRLLMPSVVMHLIGWCLFFSSGQQTVISTLDWASAFVGVEGFNFLLCGALTVVRTFSPFVMSLILPVLLWQCVEGLDATDHQGTTLFVLGSYLLYALSASASCLAAGILRMHLMMWAIFCPKMLYDVIIWALLSIVVGALLVTRYMGAERSATEGNKKER